jgi:hypothetical protein
LSAYCHQHRANDGATRVEEQTGIAITFIFMRQKKPPWAPINLSPPLKLILQGKADNEFHHVFYSMFRKWFLILKIVKKYIPKIKISPKYVSTFSSEKVSNFFNSVLQN